MVKFPAKEGYKKAEIRFYKTYKAAKAFWNNLPEGKKINFSDFRKIDLTVGGKRYSAVVKYYTDG